MKKDRENIQKETNDDDKIPKSPSNNTYRDFNKICRAYYDELMHISKSERPSLSEIDTLVINDLIHEIENYSNNLLKNNYVQPAKKIIDIGLVITDFFLKIFGGMSELSNNYKVYDSKVVGENDTSEAPIKNDEEILIIYTCWPINNIGHADERYLVYAK